ncbi:MULTISPECIES: hypothetical protein [Vibrio]|uniref:hypothetical protein n=1 Tax=Vibrio TaxID=662 RepID=UPI0018691EE3|nr:MULTISPECIES: hypothetical protein [Vibrio]MBE3666224.1 hypothetical protein [Vibrio navarrensis]MBE4579479.1 hypothetical protein [Vibrio navarrensis]MBN8105308.1 hypothetical protein [Vibrio vulnificus]
MKKGHVIGYLTLLLTLLLAGCALPQDPQGTQVALYPVDYHLAIKPQNNQIQWETVDAFLAQHKQVLLTNPVVIQFADQASAKKQALQLRSRLKKLGVSEELIQLTPVSEWNYLMSLSVTQYLPVVQQCNKTSIYEVSNVSDGCYVATNRWLSMTNPEKMIPKK